MTRLGTGRVSVGGKNGELRTHLLVFLSDAPYEEQATIHLYNGRRQGTLYQAREGVQNFESGSGLYESHGTSDDIIGRCHPSIYIQQLRWDDCSDKHIVGWGEQAFCLPDDLFNEFTNVCSKGLE